MNREEFYQKRVALLLSGGVDSAVALHELVGNGIRPDCFYIKIGSEDNDEWDCSMEEDMEMATALCHRYGVTLEVVDCHRDYWDEVTRYTIESVRAGRTPNPDVMCNRMIKFGAFDRKRGHDYDLIATGHYAQTEIDENGVKWLTTSPDPVKDQTDFLAQIYDWQLRKALFPIGHYRKEEIRAIAEREHLVNARRKDSQGICFLGKISYNDYLRRYLGEQEGDIIDIDTEQVIGHHKGHWFHTIGQRKGLGLGGGPWNVVRKDVEQNILYVVKGYEPIRAHRMEFNIKDFHFVVSRNSDNTPISEQAPELLQLPKEITFKVRHTPDYFIGTLDDLGNGCYTVHADRWVQGVAPGQFCVIYDNDFHRCFGSGEITV
ncbi:MAG: tRNA 2-thiouridine(34) synthase MnmA [Prevotella sp.]|nr:tRNA 2-thiouridine(34) synthase MnmA [Prevotella sp.]